MDFIDYISFFVSFGTYQIDLISLTSPLIHALHSNSPLESVNVKGGHCLQWPGADPYSPKLHKLHDFEPFNVVVSPILHCLQDVELSRSARFHPCGQSKHTWLPFVETYFPAAHV